MILKIKGDFGKTECSVESIAAASQHYAAQRDASGEGASTFREGVLADGRKRLRISYNGKVWDGGKVIYDPFRAQTA